MGNEIIIGNDNTVGDHNTIIKDLIATRDVNVVFTDNYQRLGRDYLDPWPIYEKADLEYFERRHWLEEQIDAFVHQESRGYFIIEAEAGVGKTAFLAERVKRFGYVHHFVELAPGQAGIVAGLMNLTAQLVRAYLSADRVTGILETVTSQFPASKEDDLSRPVIPNAAAYTNYLLDLLNKVVAKCPGERIILVIDGLDIAGTPPGQNVLGLPSVLPEGVFLIVSHRPVSISLDIHPNTPWRKVQLKANDAANLDDMRRYLRQVIKRPAIQDALTCSHCAEDWFVEAVVDKCAGVWIYTQYIIYEIEKGMRTPMDLTSLPYGMPQYYARYWKKWRNQEEDWYAIYLPVLGILAAARKKLCANDLLALTGLKMRKEALHRLLNENWRDFVITIEDHCYRFGHATLYDFCEGMVRESGLSPEDQALVVELKSATMEYALRIARKATDIEMRRDAALTLARMRWFDSCEAKEAQIDDILVYLDLVGRFLTTPSERDNIVKGLSSVLQSQDLSIPHEIQLRVYRAINYGYLNQLDEAASDYREAWRLIQTKESISTYLHTAARILLGAGNIDREKGSRVNPQKDQLSRTRLLTQAQNSYLKAAKLAEDYGQDKVLITVVYMELSWCYALLRHWDEAERFYLKALETLNHVEDAQVYRRYKAFILETASLIHWEKGQYILDARQDITQALNAYQTAYDLARDELNTLEGTLGELRTLTIAHINAGDYQLAISELPNCSDPQSFGQKARGHWNTALELAQAWGLPDLEQEAQSRLLT